ncbi:hypothetical protein IIY59_03130 [Candidatus Saccharibacteria bacterium]|jgi:hypothetical protein|nr:hypothetical protein [Candidatus Saccharibacteria bacterium]
MAACNVIHFENVKKRLKPNGHETVRIENELDDLFWNDPIAYAKLCNYSVSRKNKIPQSIKENLIEKGFIRKDDGEIPDLVKEILYEQTTGKKPFWL